MRVGELRRSPHSERGIWDLPTFLPYNARMDENKPRRRWLSFGIRDLLWAMVVVGLALGWWEESRHSFRDADLAWSYLHKKGALEKPPTAVQIEYADGTQYNVTWHSYSHTYWP